MIRIPQTALALAVFGLALTGCNKHSTEAPAVNPPADTGMSTPAPRPEEAPQPGATQPGMAQATVDGVQLGKQVGADLNISTPSETFSPKDTIYAVVTTRTSDPSASVPSKLTAKWLFDGDQVVSEKTEDRNLSGDGRTEFHIGKSDGLPAGNYTLQVSLDGKQVQSKTFKVQ